MDRNIKEINGSFFKQKEATKYCCKNCRSNEAKYNYRTARQLKEEKDHIKSLIAQYSNNEISDQVRALYNKIYNKK